MTEDHYERMQREQEIERPACPCDGGCVTRLVASSISADRPVCAYLRDGTKVGVMRDGAAAWLRHAEQDRLHPSRGHKTPDSSSPEPDSWARFDSEIPGVVRDAEEIQRILDVIHDLPFHEVRDAVYRADALMDDIAGWLREWRDR